MIDPLVSNNNNNNKVTQLFSIFTLNVRERERSRCVEVIKKEERDVQSFDIKLEKLKLVRSQELLLI